MAEPTFTFSIEEFLPGTPTSLGFAAVDAANHRIVLNEGDIPPQGALLEIDVATVFVRAQATDTETAALIAAAENNGSDGIIELLIKDDSIVDRGAANLRAYNELRLKIQSNISLSFDTKQDGWDIGQQFRFVDERANPQINQFLTVQTISQKLTATVGNQDFFQYSIQASPYVVDSDILLTKAIQNFLLPPKTPLATFVTD